ncbi:uncharacterized protein VTP21DRAFT_9232 [Calcarisporiella thermophila]|uniref:uncharacterized protein n=1 Tax=Calcarisporiella thermophila TaxID=911321 RepID=UPI003743DE05
MQPEMDAPYRWGCVAEESFEIRFRFSGLAQQDKSDPDRSDKTQSPLTLQYSLAHHNLYYLTSIHTWPELIPLSPTLLSAPKPVVGIYQSLQPRFAPLTHAIRIGIAWASNQLELAVLFKLGKGWKLVRLNGFEGFIVRDHVFCKRIDVHRKIVIPHMLGAFLPPLVTKDKLVHSHYEHMGPVVISIGFQKPCGGLRQVDWSVGKLYRDGRRPNRQRAGRKLHWIEKNKLADPVVALGLFVLAMILVKKWLNSMGYTTRNAV